MYLNGDRNIVRIRILDDWHFHFRQLLLQFFLIGTLIKHGWRGRVVAEPNTEPANITGAAAIAYCDEILEFARTIPGGEIFQPIPVMQITEFTTKQMIRDAYRLGVRVFKVYPFFVTTNSENGVKNYLRIYPALEELERLRVVEWLAGEPEIVVQFHAETPREEVEGPDKEEAFLSSKLEMAGIVKNFSAFTITIEHVSSEFGVDWVMQQPSERKIAAGLTIQHLTNTIDDLTGYSQRSRGLICPHEGFKPQAKRTKDRRAIQNAALSGNRRFFYAGDGAWHWRHKKEADRCSCGAANTLAAMPLLIDFYENAGSPEMLEPLVSEHGADVYGYPLNAGTVTFVRKDWVIDPRIEVPGTDSTLVPWRYGETMRWQIAA